MAGTDLDFELLPDDGSRLSADDDLDRALGAVDASTLGPLPQGRSWAFDFETGQFVERGRGPAEVHDELALRVWIEKTLRTARFAHAIYSDDYGIEMPDIIGRAPSPGTLGQLTTAIREALLVHDRIEAVEDFLLSSALDDDMVEVAFTVTTVDDETVQMDPLLLGGTEFVSVSDPALEARRIAAAG